MENLLELIKKSKLEDIDEIITAAINKMTASGEEKEMLGFLENNKKETVHKGYILPNTRIRYSNFTMNSYSMKTTDYIYEFGRFIKEKNIDNKGSLIRNIEPFINMYFGISSNGDRRDDYFDSLAFATTQTDEEYFEKLANLELGDLKGKNIAMCTERAAVAQNLLTLFGIETYYCIGYIQHGNSREFHCFNIAKAKNEYRLLDYSIPVPIFKDNKLVGYAPFNENIPTTEITNILENQIDISFNDYEYNVTQNGMQKVPIKGNRTYAIGKFELEQNKQHNK